MRRLREEVHDAPVRLRRVEALEDEEGVEDGDGPL